MTHTKHNQLQQAYKKIVQFFFGLLAFLVTPLFFAVPAYASQASPQGKTLIVYYSWGGHTKNVAKVIQKVTNADIIELQPVTPYPSEYRPTTVQAKEEQEKGFRPPLLTKITNFEEYDTIIIGSPNWWGTFSMPIFTFLDTYSLEGKNCAVFITHGGSQLGRAMDDIKKYTTKSNVYKGLAISDSHIQSAQKDVNTWLKDIGIIK